MKMMTTERTSLREWQKAFAAGAFDAPDMRTQIEAGWYDWFCSSVELHARLRILAMIPMGLRDSNRLGNLDDYYIWFKNNDDARRGTRDDFRITSRSTGLNKFVVDYQGDGTFSVTTLSPGDTAQDRQKVVMNVVQGTAHDIVTWMNQ